MQFAVRLPVVQGPAQSSSWEELESPGSVVQSTVLAESLGYDYVCVADHIAIPAEEVPWLRARWADPLVTLSYLAAHTSRIGLMTAAVVLPYRHPLALAKAVGTLTWLAPGRLVLGVAAGYLAREFEAMGVAFPDRGRRTNEALDALVRMTSGEHDLVVSPGADLPLPPIWVGGISKAAARRAVRYGDGWMPNRTTPGQLREYVDYLQSLDGYAAKQDRFRICSSLFAVGRYAERGELMEPAAPRPDDADRLLQEIADWSASGVTDLRLHFVTPSRTAYDEALAWFAEEVMRRL